MAGNYREGFSDHVRRPAITGFSYVIMNKHPSAIEKQAILIAEQGKQPSLDPAGDQAAATPDTS
jgi:hypothetical protein